MLSEYRVMPQLLWFVFPVGEDGMEKLNVYAFYTVGAALNYSYVKFRTLENPMIERVQALAHMKAYFEIFIDRSEGTNWKATRERAKQVLELINQRVDETTPAEIFVAPFDTGYEDLIGRVVKAFEQTFASEAEDSTVFSVTQKGTHSTLDLMERADENLPPDVRARLSDEAKVDLRQAGRCLALDCYTASGYHILRTVERVIIKYVEKASGQPLSQGNRNWGEYISKLNGLNADASVTGYLHHIKTHYRNPIIHPEDTLDANSAFALFNASLSAILQLDAAIEAWR